jgi:hypothetical protein
VYKAPSELLHKNALFMCLFQEQIHPNCYKTFSLSWELSIAPQIFKHFVEVEQFEFWPAFA